MSQALPLHPENGAMPIYNHKYDLQLAGMLQDVAHSHFRLTLLADKSYKAIFKS